MTFDGKGIVMVPRDLRPATKKAAGKAVRKLATRLTSGEKRNRKRMAEVAAIYTVPSYARTAEEVVADLNRCADREARPARPKVRNKRVWASVAEPAKAIIEETFREALARDPEHQRQWVALLDGNEDRRRSRAARRPAFGVATSQARCPPRRVRVRRRRRGGFAARGTIARARKRKRSAGRAAEQ
jgi:hypothetical protein